MRSSCYSPNYDQDGGEKQDQTGSGQINLAAKDDRSKQGSQGKNDDQVDNLSHCAALIRINAIVPIRTITFARTT
jgi:hypothetical protein